jgi:hypothetical protein
LFADHEAADV